MKPYPVQQMPSWAPQPLNGVTQQVTQPGRSNVKRSGILEAVQGKKLDVVMKIVEENPEVVNEKGFVGLQPLHKASLHGDSSVVEYLLKHGANPNCMNDFEETPLHYACKRGDLVIVKMLIDGGADVKAEDKAGRGVVHHAANGGSALMFHYLTEVLGLSTHVRDRNMNTPLHIVCSHGHTDALKYLLRKERSDLFAADHAANTALHIAASCGHGWSCWTLLSAGGLALLHLTNRDGHRPLELARQGNSCKFVDIIKLLSFYTEKVKKKTGDVSGPRGAWLFLLVAPALLYPLTLLVALCTPFTGIVTSIGIVLLAVFLFQQEHRIHHLSRWPNPSHVGLFSTGMSYTMLCYFITIVPSIYEDRPWFVLVSVLLSFLLVYLYILLMFYRDPGQCRESILKHNGFERYTLKDIASGEIRPNTFCVECELIPPKRTHHCKMCNKCYYNLDHHCLFLYGCVASNNHRLFVGFIAGCLLSMVLFVYIAFTRLTNDSELSLKLVLHVFNNKPWLWTLLVSNAVSIVWGVVLLRFQLNIVSKGLTTAYQPNMGRSRLSYRQRLRNLVNFLQGRKTFSDEAVVVC